MNNKIKIINNDCEQIIKKFNHQKFNNKKILLLGGNGFLANYIIYTFNLLISKNKVNCRLDIVSKSNPKKLLKNILNNNKSFKFFKSDISKLNELEKFKDKYDFIFFCVNYGQPKMFMANQKSTILINTLSLNYFLENCMSIKSKFLYFSSVDVYGDTSNYNGRIKEDYHGNLVLGSERGAYGESKRVGEILCKIYNKNTKKKNVKIVRPAHTYGPGFNKSDNRVIVDFINEALSNKISIKDNGKSIKTFGYIGDIVEMFFNIILSGKDEIYNTCGKNIVSIKELATEISNNFKNCKVTYAIKKNKSNYINSDNSKSIISSSKYIDEFKKKNFTSFNYGIKNLIKWLA